MKHKIEMDHSVNSNHSSHANRISISDELKMHAARVRLARNWWQTALALVFLCVLLLAWSLGYIPGEFLFLNQGNQGVIFWVALIIGSISLVFGYIILRGYQYGKQQLMELLAAADKDTKYK